MGDIVNIAFQGGTHGNFLRYFIDRFSALTPAITELPFSNKGTSHNPINYSENIEIYHPSDNNNQFLRKNEQHLLITVASNDLLFLQRIVNERAGDMLVEFNSDFTKLSNVHLEISGLKDRCKQLCNIEVDENTAIPKFIFRDILKLGFLDTNKAGFIERNTLYLSRLPANCKTFPVGAFWDKELFFSTINRIDQELNLKLTLDENADYVYDQFIKNIKQHSTLNRCETIIEALKNGENIDISEIDIVEQAYLSAWIEQNYEFVIVPLTNSFFKNTREISTWLEWYPQYYKAMNPNLPIFNGIPNPYHLHNLKK